MWLDEAWGKVQPPDLWAPDIPDSCPDCGVDLFVLDADGTCPTCGEMVEP